ncbi:hypothetical protein AcV7_001885 [Taiwanofungus camphoratus]|nr:hypothetical protein AcV7_001885 [Antrodia cinnamomea]
MTRAFDVYEHPSFESPSSRREYLILLGIVFTAAAIASTIAAIRFKGSSMWFIDAFAVSRWRLYATG